MTVRGVSVVGEKDDGGDAKEDIRDRASAAGVRDNNFDFLRFAAASMVLISHSYPLLGRTDEPIKTFTGYETGGMIAVAIFFVISGYLVTGSFVNSRGPANYVKKRCLRLLPALCTVVIASALVVGPLVSSLTLQNYFAHPQTWAYLENCYFNIGYSLPGVFADNPYPNAVNGSLWTLPIEGVMYLILLVLGWNGWLNPAVLTAALAGLCVIRGVIVGYLDLGDSTWGHVFPVGGSLKLGLFFLSGSLLYLLRNRIVFSHVVACVMGAALLGTVHTSVWPIVFQVAVPVLTIWAAHVDVRWVREFGRYGDFSYGMYLIAFPVQQLLAYYLGLMSTPRFMVLAFGITLPLAMVSWHCVEKPALAWKTKSFGLIRRPISVQASETGRDISEAGQVHAGEMKDRAA